MRLYPRSRLRHMLSGGVNPYNRDLYASNGFSLPLTNANASVKWVEDKDGVLVQSPAGVPVMPGCRFADGVWYSTDIDGTPLFTISRMIRTAQGSVAEYDETYPGVLVEPAATNIFLQSNTANVSTIRTTATTDIIDGKTCISLVDTAQSGIHTARAVTASVINTTYCLSGYFKKNTKNWIKLVQFANYANFNLDAGTIGNKAAGVTATIEASGDWWLCQMVFTAVDVQYPYIALGDNNTANWDDIYLGDGSGIYYRELQCEVGTFRTSYIPTTTATVTRAADNISFPAPAWLLAHPNDFAFVQRVIPGTTLKTAYLFGYQVDGANVFGLYVSSGNILQLTKLVGGVAASPPTGVSVDADVPHDIIAYQSAVYGVGITVRKYSGGWGAWANWKDLGSDAAKASPGIPTDNKLWIGNRNGSADYAYATYPMTRILRIPTNLSAAALQAWLIAKAGA